MFSMLNFWRSLGKRKWMNGLADLNVVIEIKELQNNTFFVAKLPKWFGERPGKKAGEPESPDDDDEGQEAPGGAGADEEEEEEEEEEEDE